MLQIQITWQKVIISCDSIYSTLNSVLLQKQAMEEEIWEKEALKYPLTWKVLSCCLALFFLRRERFYFNPFIIIWGTTVPQIAPSVPIWDIILGLMLCSSQLLFCDLLGVCVRSICMLVKSSSDKELLKLHIALPILLFLFREVSHVHSW